MDSLSASSTIDGAFDVGPDVLAEGAACSASSSFVLNTRAEYGERSRSLTWIFFSGRRWGERDRRGGDRERRSRLHKGGGRFTLSMTWDVWIDLGWQISGIGSRNADWRWTTWREGPVNTRLPISWLVALSAAAASPLIRNPPIAPSWWWALCATAFGGSLERLIAGASDALC